MCAYSVVTRHREKSVPTLATPHNILSVLYNINNIHDSAEHDAISVICEAQTPYKEGIILKKSLNRAKHTT